MRYRHAFEVRHPSCFCDENPELLGAHDCALVIADTAGKFTWSEAITTDFVYVRLNGSTATYASDYDDAELESWSSKIRRWMRGGNGRAACVYFDNDAKVHAPHNAMQLAGLLGLD